MTTQRFTKLSVTNFLHCNGKFLLLHRRADASIDPDKYNGVGGKLESGEDYLSAAIRETAEETGFIVAAADCRLTHVVRLTGGYKDDWIMCFFAIEVPTQTVPHGMQTPDGTLQWLTPEQILSGEYALVDDLNYLFPDVVAQKPVQFVAMEADDSYSITIQSKCSITESKTE